jgi:excisionase family DNA binding protein
MRLASRVVAAAHVEAEVKTSSKQAVAVDDPLLTSAEACEYLNVSDRWLRRAVEYRRIEVVKLGGRMGKSHFRKSVLDEFIEQNTLAAEG